MVFVSPLDFKRLLEAKGRSIQRSLTCEFLKNHGWGLESKLPWCSVVGLEIILGIQTGGIERMGKVLECLAYLVFW